MKVTVTCWTTWGDPRSCGYNASGVANIVENIEMEVKDKSEISSKLTANGFKHNGFKIQSVKLD